MKEAGMKLKKILGILGIASLLFFCCDVYRIFFQSGYESSSSSGAVYGEMA